MHARFQSARRPRSGFGVAYTGQDNWDFSKNSSQQPTTVVDASGTKTKVGMSDSKWDSLISGIKDVVTTGIQTVGGIEQQRLAGKSSTGGGTYQPSTGSTYQPSGSTGISGTTIAIGVGVVAVLAVGGYFVFRKK